MAEKKRQTGEIDLEDLDNGLSGDALANAINSALQDAEAAISRRQPQAADDVVIDVEEVEETPKTAETPAAPAPQGLAEIPGEKTITESGPTKREEELYERLLRMTADFENYKKRVAREKQDFAKFAYEDLVASLLPVIDNLERALAHCEESKDINALADGVGMIHRQIRDVLKKFGVRVIESVGKSFDPTKHQAVQMMASKEYKANTVIQEYQKGYFLHDRLVRPAMVVVASGEAADDEADLPTLDDGASDAGGETQEKSEPLDRN